ncbi:hypothetical protein [Agreia pratensis]|uniref:Glycosyltransferase RgtA/B/C/D-like domain-containing protein n=1 Tax=Agreia pratensis TaxID=150121 RepID=A0A1X7IDY8_9MICO|nr:hypothetical protein [Agreia pratensis]SMG12422.1 hypothetical protein SAMN06296010_0379 [Agreia pratensis]
MLRSERPREWLSSWWLRTAIIFLLTRAVFVAGFVAAQLAMNRPVSIHHMLVRWDGWWYLFLAENGYPPELNLPDRPNYGPWGFFPTWPFSIRGLHLASGLTFDASAITLTLVFGLGFVLVARMLAAEFFGERAASFSVWVVCLFPGSVALTLPYTEPFFLFFAALALWSMHKKRWGLAAAAVFFACLTRSTGVALIAACGVLLIISLIRRRGWGPILPGIAGGVALVLVGGFAYLRTGDPLIWLEAQKQWNQKLDLGRDLLHWFVVDIPARTNDHHHYAVMLASLCLVIAIVLIGIRGGGRMPVEIWVYVSVLAFSVLAYSGVGPRPRMILGMFPLLLLMAVPVSRWARPLRAIVICVFAALSAGYSFVIMYEPLHVTA